MKVITLTRGFAAIVDDSDFMELAQYPWCWDGRYAVRRKKFPDGTAKKVYMHHEIMGKPPKGMKTDHVNRVMTDNRRENLRFCTDTENGCNRSKAKNNTSGYRGVHFHKQRNKWTAQISVNGKVHSLGLFATAEAASRAYNTAALELHGAFANPN